MLKYQHKSNTLEKLSQNTKKSGVSFIILGIILTIVMILSATRVIQGTFGTKLAEVIVYAIIAIGFSYLIGYSGLASLGTAGLVGVGAYICAIFTKKAVTLGWIAHGWSIIVIAIVALIAALIIGLVIGFASLRIEGLFLAIVTLGLSEVLNKVFINANTITDGVNGYTIPYTYLFGDIQIGKLGMNITMCVVLVLILIITNNVGKSATGRAMLSMKNSTSAAQAMGISLLKYRLMAFMLSTAYAALAGVLYMAVTKFTVPSKWSLVFSLNILAACVFGGSRNLWGIMFGAFLIFGLEPLFLVNVTLLRDNSWLLSVIIGVILILIVLFYRGGVIQLLNDIKRGFMKLTRRWRAKKYGYDEEQ